jgi:hypothetical protein
MSSLLYCHQDTSIKMCTFYSLNKNNKVFTKNSYICILHYIKRKKCALNDCINLIHVINNKGDLLC